MIKDYIAVSKHDLERNEIDYVNEYWTKKWVAEDGYAVDLTERIKKLERSEEWKLLQKYLTRPMQILDGGCGMGQWTIALSERGHSVVGLDISSSTIRKLKMLFPASDFRVGDMREADFEDESFDIIFSWGAFEHFEDGMDSCLNEAYRLLRPGGHLFITVPFQNWRHAIRSMVDRGMGNPESISKRFYQWRFTRGEVGEQMRSCGFEVDMIKPIHRRHGLYRILTSGLGLRERSVGFWIGASLLFWLPSMYASHMLIAHGWKR